MVVFYRFLKWDSQGFVLANIWNWIVNGVTTPSTGETFTTIYHMLHNLILTIAFSHSQLELSSNGTTSISVGSVRVEQVHLERYLMTMQTWLSKKAIIFFDISIGLVFCDFINNQ